MKRISLLFSMALLLAASCKNPQGTAAADKKADRQPYFPVADFLKSEIHYVDSLPLGITKYTVEGDKTDTAYIQAPEFNRIASDFICEELRPDIFEKEFSESSFIDASTHAATFTYAPRSATRELKRVDVLTGTDATVNKVSSIYLEKSSRSGDTLVIKKLLWRPKISLQIASSRQVGEQAPVQTQVKLVWGIE